jgi:hypothetical protein
MDREIPYPKSSCRWFDPAHDAPIATIHVEHSAGAGGRFFEFGSPFAPIAEGRPFFAPGWAR